MQNIRKWNERRSEKFTEQNVNDWTNKSIKITNVSKDYLPAGCYVWVNHSLATFQ